jgi:hypothetical protein
MLFMFRFFVFLAYLATVFQSPAFAQHTITGTVSDSSSLRPVSFANVALHRKTDTSLVAGVAADSAGHFFVSHSSTGDYILRISALGYLTFSVSVKITEDKKSLALGTVLLRPDARLLQSVTVRGEKPPVQYRSDRTVLNIGGNSFFKSSANATDILRRAPGVSFNPDGNLLLSGQNSPVLFINGKPVEMSREEMLAYLNSLNPETIKAIEIITSPSSRYDGQYKGIIDLKLKTDQSSGWKGSLVSNLRRHVYSHADNSLNLSYKRRDLTYSLRAAHVSGDDYYRYTALQRLAAGHYMNTYTHTRTNNNNPALQAGISYALRKNQNLDLLFKTYQSNRLAKTSNILTFQDSLRNETLDITQTDTRAKPRQRTYAGNIAYDATFGDNKLNVFGTVTSVINKQQEDIRIADQRTGDLKSHWKTRMHNQVLIRSAQVDFSRTLANGKFDAGSKYAFITTDNDMRYDTLALDNLFVPDAGRSNAFRYREYIAAGYFSYGFNKEKLNVNLSLRAEHTRTIAHSITEDSTRKRNYLNWLPALNISYQFRAESRLTLRANRRLTRPNFDQLNPFRFYISPLNYRVGNPYLRPSVTSSAQLTYNSRKFSTTLMIGRENDQMVRYPEYNPVTNDLLYLGTNVPYRNFASLEATYTASVTSWWKTTYNAGVYYNKQKMPYLGRIFEIGITDFAVWGSQVFTLPAGLLADLTYRYNSWGGNSLYLFRPSGSVDVGLQRSWLGGKLISRLNAYDLFYTILNSLIFREIDMINNRLEHRFRTRRLMLSLTYQFGSATYKSRENRSSEEERRSGN